MIVIFLQIYRNMQMIKVMLNNLKRCRCTLVNLDTLDVKLIDLDGIGTTYGPDDYILEYSYAKRTVLDSFNSMRDRIFNCRDKVNKSKVYNLE